MNYAFQAHEYQALPKQGGLRDQPARLLLYMRVAYNVWRAVESYISSPNSVEWAQRNASEWKIAAEALSLAESRKG